MNPNDSLRPAQAPSRSRGLRGLDPQLGPLQVLDAPASWLAPACRCGEPQEAWALLVDAEGREELVLLQVARPTRRYAQVG